MKESPQNILERKFQNFSLDHASKVSKNALDQEESSKESEPQSLTAIIKREDLTNIKGIGTQVAERLINNGIRSIETLSQSSPQNLAKIKISFL